MIPGELCLHVDADLLVVNKPPGISSVPGGWQQGEGSLFEHLKAEYPSLWIVHRLDKGTSGVLLFARNAETHRALSMLFESGAIHKTYHALASGIPKWEEHTARHPLRLNAGHSHRSVVDASRGKPAETRFKVLERFSECSLLEACPATGRTHQVRVPPQRPRSPAAG